MSFHRKLLAALVVALAPGLAAADGPSNTLTISPLLLAGGAWRIEFERAFGDSLSLYVAPTYWSYDFASLGPLAEFLEYEGVDVESFGVGAGLRLFLTGTAPEGIWLAPGVEFHQIEGEFEGITATSPGWAAGAQLGVTWLIGDVFDLSVGAGADYMDRELSFAWKDQGVAEQKIRGYKGVIPTARVVLGVAF